MSAGAAAPAASLFDAGRFRVVELGPPDEARLQAFFDANPEYELTVAGRRPPHDAAAEEIAARPPEGFAWSRRWLLAFDAPDGTMAAVADVVSDLFAERVWHVGLFIVATALHGRGVARPAYDALEAWIRASGAQWLRLGVVAGNARAERFWASCGYAEVRVREGVTMGERVNAVRVMVKPLRGGELPDYLERVARDRPGAP